MKTTKYIVSVVSLLLLVGCSNNASSDSSISSLSSQSNVTSASTSEEKVEPKDIDLYKEFCKETFSVNPNYSFDFMLGEFANVSFKVNKREGEQLYDVSKNGEVILSSIYSPTLCASDINKDGYRELVAKGETGNASLIIYDIHNAQTMYKKDLYNEEIPGLNNIVSQYLYYTYTPKIFNNKLCIAVSDGMASNRIYDYLYVNYAADKGVSLEYQNMYDIAKFELIGFKGEANASGLYTETGMMYFLGNDVREEATFRIIRKENPDLNRVLVGLGNTANVFPAQGICAFIDNEIVAGDSIQLVPPSSEDGFGEYTLKVKLNGEINKKGTVKLVYCGFSISFNYTIVS